MTTRSSRPVTRETSAKVFDKGMRAVLVTIDSSSVIELRAKGLRGVETLDVAWCYGEAVKQRVAEEKRYAKQSRGAGKSK
jgi:hypothetical protein